MYSGPSNVRNTIQFWISRNIILKTWRKKTGIPITLNTILTHICIRIPNCSSSDNLKCHHSSTFWVLYIIIYILYYNNSIIGRLHLITRSRHFTRIYCALFVLSNIKLVYINCVLSIAFYVGIGLGLKYCFWQW